MPDELTPGFQVKVVPKAGLLDKLRGRVPKEAAIVEIRNILATTAFDQVRESEIADALAKAKLLPREANAELTAVFEEAALVLTNDRELGDSDRHALDVLKRAFELSEEEAEVALERAVSTIYEQTLRKATAGPFTSADKVRLDQVATALRLRGDRARELYSTAARAAL